MKHAGSEHTYNSSTQKAEVGESLSYIVRLLKKQKQKIRHLSTLTQPGMAVYT